MTEPTKSELVREINLKDSDQQRYLYADLTTSPGKRMQEVTTTTRKIEKGNSGVNKVTVGLLVALYLVSIALAGVVGWLIR